MSAGNRTLTWVVGAGGLLGRAVVTTYATSGTALIWSLSEPIAWDDGERAEGQLRESASRFIDDAVTQGLPWRVLWCAGAGVVATDPERLEQETRLFRSFSEGLRRAVEQSAPHEAGGTIFLASSAGAVYGGSPARPPYDEASPVGTRSAYGQEKLVQEAVARAVGEALGVSVLIGRISNLYGPDQNPRKPQGLVTHVGRAALRREPLRLYVPLDTIRDYILAGDAATLIRRVMGRLEAEPSSATVVRIIASEVGTSVAAVISSWKIVLKRSPGVVMASSSVGRLQPPALSFRSRVWPELRIEPTPLPIGVHAVHAAQLRELRMGRL